jgi:opacity protein-like surface antigen
MKIRPFSYLRNATIATIATLLASAGAAHAQYYGGISLTRAAERTEFGFNGVERPAEMIALNQLSGTLSAEPRQSLGIKLGYRFTPYFSLEGSFADRNTQLSMFRNDSFNSNLPTSLRESGRERAMSLDLVGSYALRERVTLQGRVGVKTDFVSARPFGESGLLNTSRAQNMAVVGAGMQVNVSKSLGLRLDVERTRNLFTDRIDGNRFDANKDSVSFGVLWRF